MTNILILHPDIPQASVMFDASEDWEPLHSINNAKGGFRSAVLRSVATTSATVNLDYTLPTGTTKAASFLYIPRFKKRGVESWGGDLALQNSSDGFTWNTVIYVTDVSDADMSGYRDIDFFRSFTLSDARQYWRLSFTNIQTPRRLAFGTPMFGVPFDLESDWSSWSIASIDDDSPVYTQVDSAFTGKTGEYRRQISAEWEGVSSAKVAEFDSVITAKKDLTAFVLYASTHDFVTDEDEFLHCRLQDVRHVKTVNADYSRISATLAEE